MVEVQINAGIGTILINHVRRHCGGSEITLSTLFSVRGHEGDRILVACPNGRVEDFPTDFFEPAHGRVA